MKNFVIKTNGEVPKIVADIINKYNGEKYTKDLFYCLDQDITFLVCDLKLCSGNTDGNGGAWLCDKSGNVWNVTITKS